MLQRHQMEKQLLENQQDQRERENNYEIEKIKGQIERKRQQDIENERKMQMMQHRQREQQEKKRLEQKLCQQQQLLTKLTQQAKQHEWQDEISSFLQQGQTSTPTPATPHPLQLQQANTEMQQFQYYQHPHDLHEMTWMPCHGGHQSSIMPPLQGVPEQPQPVRPLYPRGQINSVFFHPTCDLSLPETNPETQSQSNFSCNDNFNNFEAEVKIDFINDTSKASQSSSGQESDNPPVTLDQLPFESHMTFYDQPQNETTSRSESSSSLVRETPPIKVEPYSSLIYENPLIKVDQLPTESPMRPESSMLLTPKCLEMRRDSQQPESEDQDNMEILIRRSGSIECEEVGCDWKQEIKEVGWRLRILNHFLDQHGDDLSQLKFRDSEGQCVQLQDLFFHGSQGSQEECNTIKDSIDKSILAVICADTDEHQQHPQQLEETNLYHQESLGVPITDQPQPVRPSSSRGQIDPVFSHPTCDLSLPENPETQIQSNFSRTEYFNNLELHDDLDTNETSQSSSGQESDNPPVTLDQIQFESLLTFYDQPQNETSSLSESSSSLVRETPHIKVEPSSCLIYENPLIIEDELPTDSPMRPEPSPQASIGQINQLDSNSTLESLIQTPNYPEITSSPLTSEDSSHDSNIITQPPVLVEKTNCTVSVYKCSKCSFETSLNKAWKRRRSLLHWLIGHKSDVQTLEFTHTTTGQKLMAGDLFNMIARCSVPGSSCSARLVI